jgi:excisionase family DNA binding protein
MPDTDAFSFEEFCNRHRICRATLYNLIKRGEGPAVMRVGGRVLISREAAEQWRRRMEAESACGETA